MKQNVEKKKWDEIKVGDEVKVLTYGQKGEILELLDDNEAVVQMGIIKMKLPTSDLEKRKRQKKHLLKWLNVKIVKVLKWN